MAVSAPLAIFGTRPALLRRVSSDSFYLPGQLVEVLGGYGAEASHVRVKTRRGGIYSLPKGFLETTTETDRSAERHGAQRTCAEASTDDKNGEKTGESGAKSTESRRGNTYNHTPIKDTSESSCGLATARIVGEILGSGDEDPHEETNLLHRPITPEQRAQRSRWRQSLPLLTDEASPTSQVVIGGHQVAPQEEKEAIVIARDGTYRPASTSAYRGLRAIAAQQATGRQFGTQSRLQEISGMVTVTLIQPPRRDQDSIRAAVLKAIVATGTEDEYRSTCQRLRANQPEKRLAERVRSLRGVEVRGYDNQQKRREVGFTVQEIRSV